MDVVSITLLLMLAVVASGALARMLPPVIPAPVVQIALGFCIGISADHRVELDPELFFLLFLPPLLFLDGWRIPKDDLRRDVGLVAELALGLVVITVLGAGFFIHWMIPVLPLAAAFCLAAVLSPTDPIAVSAIAERISVPPRLMHILEGESMFNDASGLVCLQFAIAAAMTGGFSAGHAALSFGWLAGGGCAIGVGVTFGVVRLRDRITARFGEEAGWQILVSLLLPFGAYLLAERLGCSGVLAAVSAGVAMTFAERPHALEAESRLRRNSVWDAIQFAMNGIIFVLLGEQLPQIFAGAVAAVRDHGHGTGWWLGGYVLAITGGLAALRFAWVWASLRLTLFRAKETRPFRSSDLRLVGVMSVAGVRGALTLAGILTVPLTLSDGAPFPGRDFVIFLAAGVILVSLAVASIGLPLLLRGLVMPADPEAGAQEAQVRAAVYAAAARAVERERTRLADDPDAAACVEAVAERIAADWRAKAERPAPPDPALRRERQLVERMLHRAALEAARDEAVRLARTREAPSLLARRIVRELDLAELRSAP